MIGKDSFYSRHIKRWGDLFCSITTLLLGGWLFIVIAILVRKKLGRPILFSQERPGKGEKVFRLYKFRTMSDKRDANGNLLPDEERMTKFGCFLRSTSLDELPEIINIIKGDMSLIGPRPLLVKYLPLYNEFQKQRHDVRPGLSGWAQVNGRNTINWKERFELDVWYVNHVSFMLDLKIILMSILKAFVKKEGITSQTSVTMEEFKGE